MGVDDAAKVPDLGLLIGATYPWPFTAPRFGEHVQAQIASTVKAIKGLGIGPGCKEILGSINLTSRQFVAVSASMKQSDELLRAINAQTVQALAAIPKITAPYLTAAWAPAFKNVNETMIVKSLNLAVSAQAFPSAVSFTQSMAALNLRVPETIIDSLNLEELNPRNEHLWRSVSAREALADEVGPVDIGPSWTSKNAVAKLTTILMVATAVIFFCDGATRALLVANLQAAQSLLDVLGAVTKNDDVGGLRVLLALWGVLDRRAGSGPGPDG